METIDFEGMFWVATDPENRIFGRLRFDPVGGGQLTVHGTLYEESLAIDERNHPPTNLGRILGSARGRSVTLENCWCIARNIRPTSTASFSFDEEYSVEYVLDGAHFTDLDSLRFHAVRLRLRHLEPWVNETLVTSSPLDGPDHDRWQLISEPRKQAIAIAEFGTVQLGTSVFRRSSMFEWVLRQESSITLDFAKASALDDIFKYCVSLQNLITLGAHKPSTMFDVRLFITDPAKQVESGRSFDTGVQLYAVPPGSRILDNGIIQIPRNMLFTCESFGGAPGVARWCELTSRIEPVVEALMSGWYSPWMDPEMQFFNVLSSAETLARIRSGRQRIGLKNALVELAEQAGPRFAALVSDTNQWAKAVVQTRVTRVVHRGLHEDAALPDWGKLSKSIYFVVVMSLLKECNVPDHELDAVAQKLSFFSVS